MLVKSFRDLRVWQAGMDLVEQLNQVFEQATSLGKQLYALRNALIKGVNRQK